MVLFFNNWNELSSTMWLKICYVLKNNKDKLLGYIHIPTRQDDGFGEEIRWVPARKKSASCGSDGSGSGGGIGCTTPELESKILNGGGDSEDENDSLLDDVNSSNMMATSNTDENEDDETDSSLLFDSSVLTYRAIDEIVCGVPTDPLKVEEGEEDLNVQVVSSPTTTDCINEDQACGEESEGKKTDATEATNEDDSSDMKSLLSDSNNSSSAKESSSKIPSMIMLPSCSGEDKKEKDQNTSVLHKKELTVEIRYKPKYRKTKTAKKTTKKSVKKKEGIDSGVGGDEGRDETTTDDVVDTPRTDINDNDEHHHSRFEELEKISLNNKIKFIYTQGGESEDIFRVPQRQEDFDKGLRNPSSSPRKPKKSSGKENHFKKLKTSSRIDTTFTLPACSSELKELIYRQWLERKRRQLKRETKQKVALEKRAEKEAREEEMSKQMATRKILEAWNTSKEEEQIIKECREKLKRKAQKEKLQLSLQKQREAERYYSKWKRDKDERIRKEKHQQKKEEKEKDKLLCRQRRESSEEALRAFNHWKARKTKDQANQKKKEEEEKAKQGEQKIRQFEKKQEALRIYEQWKCHVKKARSPTHLAIIEKGAWIPAGCSPLKPEGRQKKTRNRGFAR